MSKINIVLNYKVGNNHHALPHQVGSTTYNVDKKMKITCKAISDAMNIFTNHQDAKKCTNNGMCRPNNKMKKYLLKLFHYNPY